MFERETVCVYVCMCERDRLKEWDRQSKWDRKWKIWEKDIEMIKRNTESRCISPLISKSSNYILYTA